MAQADARLIRRGGAALVLWLGLLGLPAMATAQDPRLTVPPGFAIDVFSAAVGSPRFMALDPAGTLLVSEPARGRVLALPDKDGDGKADSMQIVVDGLNQPHGLAFRDGQLYVAEMGRVVRFHYDPATMKASQGKVLVSNLPAPDGHWTRTVVFGPDGRMYVSVGSSCNVCRENDRRRAAVLRYSADGGGEQIFSSGLRNAVGLAFHPTTGVLWATVNERDWRGDDVPPDYVTEIREGTFHGWPDCMVVGGKVVVDTRFATGRCAGVTPPVVEIQAHSAPIGLTFYTGTQFPEEYRGSLFAAFRGSWNRSVPTGYKIVRIPFRDGRPAGPPEDFATGWLDGTQAWGRPVDVIVGRDGALYLSTQDAGRIYRISHRS